MSEPIKSPVQPSRVLVVAAHPDDAEFGCGGTVAKWAKAGTSTMCLIATNGDKGDDAGILTSKQLAFKREEEQRNASQTLGVVSVQFLGNRDGELTVDGALRASVVKWIRKWRPDAVFTHDPDVLFHRGGHVNHSDHRAIGLATVDAVYPYARGRLNFPEHEEEGLTPHKVADLFLWGTNEANHWEDVTDFVEVKLKALLCHLSQYKEGTLTRRNIEEHLLSFGEGANLRLAESFRHISFANNTSAVQP